MNRPRHPTRAAVAPALAGAAFALLAPTDAAAQFSEPPREAVLAEASDGRFAEPPAERRASTVRASLGPVLRANDGDAGLYAALDFGPARTGFRASAAWIDVGSKGGLSQYTGELWIDFVAHGPFHPVLGAGAGLARREVTDASGELEASHLGIGVASARIEYLLPIDGTDARAALALSGALPAIRGAGDPDTDPWLLAFATLGVGF